MKFPLAACAAFAACPNLLEGWAAAGAVRRTMTKQGATMVRERRTGEDDVNRRAAASGRSTAGGSTLDPRTLDEIIRRVVEVTQPERIILFGSAARGEMTRHSDVDLLIVSDRGDALDLMRRIYRRLGGVGVPVDALVVSTADVARYRDSHALIIKPALREGRTVHESA